MLTSMHRRFDAQLVMVSLVSYVLFEATLT